MLDRVKILWSFVCPHRFKLLLAILLGLIATAAGLATPMVTKWVLDTLGGDLSLTGPIMALIGLLLVSSITGYAQWVTLGNLAERAVYQAQSSLISRFFRAQLGPLQKYKPGELVTRVTSDTLLLREATSSSLVDIVNGSISLVGTLILMAVLDWTLLLATLGLLLLLLLASLPLMPKIAEADRVAQDSVGDLGGTLESGLKALKTVKSSLAEDREIERATSQAYSSMTYQIRSVKISALVWSIVGSGMQLAIIAILGLGSWRIAQGQLEVSSLVAFLLYAFNIVGPITELTQAVTSLQSGFAAAARIQETQDLPQENLDAKAQEKADQPNPKEGAYLQLDKVSASYEGSQKKVLDGISLSFPARGHTALVGPSGAGKTSLFALLLRFLEPQTGRIYLDGRPYQDLSLRQVRSQIAYVEQETPVLPGSIADNVRYRSPQASDQEVLEALAAVHLDQKVLNLPEGLNTQVTATSLSGGERQRLAIARALVNPPRVLLLDEATAQLDGLTEAAVLEAIEKIAQTSTVITIAHRLSTVVDADEIVVLEAGRVQARGKHEQLLEQNQLYRDFITALKIQA